MNFMPEHEGPGATDGELLRRYAVEKAEDAFGELVRRHVDVVYAVALRKVGGDAHLAQDVTQRVFTDLATKAASLINHPALVGWLFTGAHFVATQLVRAERRRRAREHQAHAMHEPDFNPVDVAIDRERLRPVLDDLLLALDERDRAAVLLRFFEGRAFAEVGAQLQLSEDGARSRVERALEKLRAALARRGLTSSTTALAATLGTQAATAAPASVVSGALAAALAVPAATGASAMVAGSGLFVSFFAGAKTLAVVAGVIVSGASVVATLAGQQANALRTEREAIEQNVGELHPRLAARQQDLAAANRQAQAAEAEVGQMLKDLQNSPPGMDLPPADAACIAFVIDTSGSMRDPRTNGLWRTAHDQIAAVLNAHPEVRFLQGVDANGAVLFSGQNQWLPRTADVLATIDEALARRQEDTPSNPVPGLYRALRGLPLMNRNGAKLHVWVIGDEFSSGDSAEAVLRRLDELNPADAQGKRSATISAIQLPTTIRFTGGSMANTGLKFQTLMTEIARQHSGTYRLVPDQELH